MHFVLLLSFISFIQLASAQELGEAVDRAYVFYGGILTFVMQAGFTMLEAGSVRVKNTKNILLKNMMDTAVAAVGFYLTGYAFAFGNPDDVDQNEVVGVGNFLILDLKEFEFWFFQWGFASATVTIISGSIAERTKFIGYMSGVIMYSMWVYPVVAHWAWAEDGWLFDDGNVINGVSYVDFAGSGVVHSVGGWAGFVGSVLVGPRLGRFVDGKACVIAGYSTTLITLGIFILWFGWYGFNPASTLGLTGGNADLAGKVATTTTLSAASAGLTLLTFHRILKNEFSIMQVLNGVLGGLVAITAPCAYVEPWAAVIIGAVGSLVYRGFSELIVLIKVDDPVDAFPVHGGAGLWGVLSVGLFHSDNGLFIKGEFAQLGIQAIGILTIIVWASGWAAIIFGFLKAIGQLRVDAETERKGIESQDRGEDSYARVEIMDNGRMDEFQFKIQ